jgi:hypothetical protein
LGRAGFLAMGISMRRKGYLQTVKNDIGKSYRTDVTFTTFPKNAVYYESREEAEQACKLLNGYRLIIASNEGGSYLLHGFNVEELRPGKYAVCCEGPFIGGETVPT